jgi:hypothetical protein
MSTLSSLKSILIRIAFLRERGRDHSEASAQRKTPPEAGQRGFFSLESRVRTTEIWRKEIHRPKVLNSRSSLQVSKRGQRESGIYVRLPTDVEHGRCSVESGPCATSPAQGLFSCTAKEKAARV